MPSDHLKRSISAVEFRKTQDSLEDRNKYFLAFLKHFINLLPKPNKAIFWQFIILKKRIHIADFSCVLRIEKKRFDYINHKQLLNEWHQYLEDDREAKNFPMLFELPIHFPPT